MFSIFTKVNAENKSFFDFSIDLIDGKKIELSEFKGKSILLVNVASNCGFTKQYSDLQELYEVYQTKGLIVLGVPSNQFGSQEPENEKIIKDFCETNFNISFPMTSKYNVKGKKAHPIYVWAKETYGNSAVPKWNFHKILINSEGKVQDTFTSFTNPMSSKITRQIDRMIK